MSVDVNFGLHSLYHVDIGSILDVSEVHGTSVIRIEMSRTAEYSCIYRLQFSRPNGQKDGAWCLVWDNRGGEQTEIIN
jgi:hypothetical protein